MEEGARRRAAWAVKWCKGLREAGIANTAAMEECVGRLSFIAGMLEYDRPFFSAIRTVFWRWKRGTWSLLSATLRRSLSRSHASEWSLLSGHQPLWIFAGNEFADRLAAKGAEARQHSEWTVMKIAGTQEFKPGRCRGALPLLPCTYVAVPRKRAPLVRARDCGWTQGWFR